MSNLQNIKTCTQAFDVIYKNRKNKNSQNTTVSKNKPCASSWFMGFRVSKVSEGKVLGVQLIGWLKYLQFVKVNQDETKNYRKKKYYCQLKTFTKICFIYFDFFMPYLCLVIPTISLDFFYTSQIQFDMMPPKSVWRMGLNKTEYESNPTCIGVWNTH